MFTKCVICHRLATFVPPFGRKPYPLLTNYDKFRSEYIGDGCTSPPHGPNGPRAERPVVARSYDRLSVETLRNIKQNNTKQYLGTKANVIYIVVFAILGNGTGKPREHTTFTYQAYATRGAVLGASLSGQMEHTRISKHSRRQQATVYHACGCSWRRSKPINPLCRPRSTFYFYY